MTETRFDDWIGGAGGLPDPETDPQFYDGVPVRRLVAALIDAAIVWGGAVLFVILTLGLGLFVIGGFVLVADFTHRVLLLTARSSTLGMGLMRIELRRYDGRRFDLPHAIGHTVLCYIAGVSVIAQIVSIVMMAGSSLGRGLHDLPFGSTMINSPA